MQCLEWGSIGKAKKRPTFELLKRYDAVYSGNALEITNRHTKTLSIDYNGMLVAQNIKSNIIRADSALFEQSKHLQEPAVVQIVDIKSTTASLIIHSIPDATCTKSLSVKNKPSIL